MGVANKIIFFLGVSFTLFFQSCRTSSTEKADTTLDIRLPKEPEKLNPVLFPNSISREVCQYLFLPLADFDPVTLKLTPILVTSVPEGAAVNEGPHKGGVRYDFEIVADARWDDGKPVTGEDYLFTVKAAMHPGTSASSFRSILSNFADVVVDAANPKKVSVYFDGYFMLAKEAVLNVEVLPKHIYDPNNILDKYSFTDFLEEEKAEKLVASDSSLIRFAADINGPKFSKEVVAGCGPYRLSSWKSGEYILLEKKEPYWAAGKGLFAFQQNADKIILHIIPDETAAYTRLKNGELDVLSGVSSSNFEALKKDSSDGFSFQTPQLARYYNIIINQRDPILSSVKVRKALAHLTNVNALINNFENGNATAITGPVNPVKSYYNKNIRPYSFDVDKASQLLKEEGWTDSDGNGILDKNTGGKKTTLKIPVFYSGELGKNICLQLQSDARKAGVELDIQFKEFAGIRKENLETGKFSMVLQAVTQDITDDDFYLRFHSDNAEAGEGNYGFYTNKEADKLIDAIRTEKDRGKREVLYQQFQVIMYETLPYIFLYSPKERILISKRWEGSTNIKRPGYQANTFVPSGK